MYTSTLDTSTLDTSTMEDTLTSTTPFSCTTSKSTTIKSGVKALHVHFNESIYILSGGDDNALCLLKVNPDDLTFEKYVDLNAHSSSVVGVYMKDNVIYSTSIDQRLNKYLLTSKGLEFVQDTFVEIADCSAMAVSNQLAIVGHGIQVFSEY